MADVADVSPAEAVASVGHSIRAAVTIAADGSPAKAVASAAQSVSALISSAADGSPAKAVASVGQSVVAVVSSAAIGSPAEAVASVGHLARAMVTDAADGLPAESVAAVRHLAGALLTNVANWSAQGRPHPAHMCVAMCDAPIPSSCFVSKAVTATTGRLMCGLRPVRLSRLTPSFRKRSSLVRCGPSTVASASPAALSRVPGGGHRQLHHRLPSPPALLPAWQELSGTGAVLTK